MGSWTLDTRFPYDKYELVWTASLFQSKCAEIPSGRGTDRMNWSRSCQRQSCGTDQTHCQGVVAEAGTAGLQGQHSSSTGTVQMTNQSKPVKQFQGTTMSVECFSNS